MPLPTWSVGHWYVDFNASGAIIPFVTPLLANGIAALEPEQRLAGLSHVRG